MPVHTSRQTSEKKTVAQAITTCSRQNSRCESVNNATHGASANAIVTAGLYGEEAAGRLSKGRAFAYERPTCYLINALVALLCTVDSTESLAVYALGGVPSALATTTSIWINASLGKADTPTTLLAGTPPGKNVL